MPPDEIIAGFVKPGGRQHIGVARPTERGEHVELARLQPGGRQLDKQTPVGP